MENHVQTDNSQWPDAERPGRAARRARVAPIGQDVYAYARPRKSPWQRLWRPMAVAATVAGVMLGVRVGAAYGGAGDTLALHVESQQPLTIDLRSGIARSPYVFGMNVFPPDGTRAPDGAYGFMPYDARTVNGLRGAGITMLRFPGGMWGEQHTPSYEQI